jgi:energy-coupling factor transporter transmembrane protein EcfT
VPPPAPAAASRSDTLVSLLLFGASVAIMFVNAWPVLAACAALATAVVQVFRKGSPAALVRPLTGCWVLFLFIILVNLFFSYGIRYEWFPLITHEGVELAIRQSLRLWTWLQISMLFPFFNFTAVLFSLMRRVFSRRQSTLAAGLLSLEYFPAVAQEGKRYAQERLRALIHRRPEAGAEKTGRVLQGLFSAVVSRIASGMAAGRQPYHR